MKHEHLRCENIPDRPILEFLRDLPCYPGTNMKRNGTWYDHNPPFENTVLHVMPPGVPQKLVLAKMSSLIRRGLVEGCACGCRGDFEITEKGLAALNKE